MKYQLEATDSHAKGKAKHLEAALLDALAGGNFKLFRVADDGTRQEVYVSDAVHSQGHSTFHPKDAKQDKHAPHSAPHDGAISFTISDVP